MVADFSTVSSVGLQNINTNFAQRITSGQNLTQGYDGTIFTGNSNNAAYLDSVEIQQQQQQQQNVEILRQKLKDVMDEQGIIGNFWNGVKNFFNVGASSNKAEKAIEQYKKGEISFEEAEAAINNFKTKQKGGVDLLTSIGTGLAVAGSIALGVVTGGASIAIGAAIGAGVKAGSKFLDRATNKVEGDAFDLKQIAKDGLSGALDGAVTVLTAGIGKAAKATGTVAEQAAGSAVKETAATAAKQATGEAVKQTAAATAKRTVGAAIKQGAIQGAKRGAATGALMGAGNYTIEAVFEDDVDFTLGGLVSSTVQGAAVGGAIGGATGAISSGIKQYKINSAASAKAEAAYKNLGTAMEKETDEGIKKAYQEFMDNPSEESLKKFYRKAVKAYHPDNNSSEYAQEMYQLYKDANTAISPTLSNSAGVATVAQGQANVAAEVNAQATASTAAQGQAGAAAATAQEGGSKILSFFGRQKDRVVSFVEKHTNTAATQGQATAAAASETAQKQGSKILSSIGTGIKKAVGFVQNKIASLSRTNGVILGKEKTKIAGYIIDKSIK